ncbi:MAG: NIPSNAP family protein [Gammaproteobacteria bacterium]
MIAWFRTYSAQIGRMEELMKLSQTAVKHLRKAHGVKCEMYTQMGGDPTRIGLVGRYKDMTALSKTEKALSSDTKWADILKQARGLVVEGSVEDQFWKEV